jgi:general secretion pathway protein K
MYLAQNGSSQMRAPSNWAIGTAIATIRRPERGFVIVAVLWMMAMIAALLLIYLSYVVHTGNLVSTVTQRVQTDALMRAAVELTAYQLGQSKDNDRPTHGVVDTRLGAAQLRIAFRSEGARVDLNSGSKELLAGLMQQFGAPPAEARTYADRIMAWRAPAKSRSDEPEDAYYLGLGIPYAPRHAPFPATDELWLVQGIPPPLIERMMPFVTVFSNQSSVNVSDAAPEVLAALPGMTPEKMQAVLNAREDPSTDSKALNSQFGGDAKPPKAFRLSAGIRSEQGNQAQAEIVILLLKDGDDPYRVLSWRDE